MISSSRVWLTLGFGFLALALGLGALALDHMRVLAAYGVICGGSPQHCPACPAAIAATLLGVGALTLAAGSDRRAIAT